MELQKSHPCDYSVSRENNAGWCHTNVQVANFSYTWTISNFRMLTDKIESSTFSTGHNEDLEWRLAVFPRYSHNSEEYLSVYLYLVSATRAEVEAKYTFSIINAHSEKTNVRHSIIPEKFVKDKGRGYVHFLSTNYLLNHASVLLPNDKLTISVEVNFIANIVNITKGNTRSHINVPDCQLVDEMKGLLETKQLSDVVFDVSGREVWAHKAILAARSPVFSTMFQQEMIEQLTGRVEVNDIELPVFSEMLLYIYTGEAPNLHNLAEGLLEAAEKYDLRRLKALSEAALCKTLGIKNAAKRLMLADFYKAQRLKSLAIDFINMHTKDVVKTAGFAQLGSSYPNLLTEVLLATVTEKKIADKETNKGGIVDLMLLLPGDFLETKIILFLCWVGGSVCKIKR